MTDAWYAFATGPNGPKVWFLVATFGALLWWVMRCDDDRREV